MIVDVHTHVPTHQGAVPAEHLKYDPLIGAGLSLTGSVEQYLTAMTPVDRAIVFGIAPRPGQPEPPIMDWRLGWPEGLNQNDIAVEVAKKTPGKFIPFMSLHPMQVDVNEEYDRSVSLGCRGIKLSLSYQVVDPLGEDAFRLYARLEDDGLPIMFHQGASISSDARLTYAHPLMIDQVAIAFPRLKMVLAHMAHPWHADCLTVVRKHPNVWADMSGLPFRPWLGWNGLRLFHEYNVTGKILLGSDWPLGSPQDTVEGLRGLNKFAKNHHLPGVPEAEIEGIINRDSLEILGLD